MFVDMFACFSTCLRVLGHVCVFFSHVCVFLDMFARFGTLLLVLEAQLSSRDQVGDVFFIQSGVLNIFFYKKKVSFSYGQLGVTQRPHPSNPFSEPAV